MPASNDVPPVDIALVETSNSFQSHLSMAGSATRFRALAQPSQPSFSSNLDPSRDLLADNIALPIVGAFEKLGLLSVERDRPTLPTSRSFNRLASKRLWARRIQRWFILLYCAISCGVTLSRLYHAAQLDDPRRYVASPVASYQGRVLAVRASKTNMIGVDNLPVGQYLLRSLVTPSNLEPNVVLPSNWTGVVTACAWTTDTHLRFVEQTVEWAQSWSGMKATGGCVDKGLMLTFRSNLTACRHRLTAEFTEPPSTSVQVETHICIVPRNVFARPASTLGRNTAKPQHVSQHCPPFSTDEMDIFGTCSSIVRPARPTSPHSMGNPSQAAGQG